MLTPEDVGVILDRIARGTHTKRDIEALRGHLLFDPARNVVQVGKYNIAIEQGQNIHVGDRIYRGPDAETLREVLRQVLAESRPRPGAPFQAPPLPPYFVPRPEVSRDLKARLLVEKGHPSGVLVVSAIHGLGGIGKSTLAAAIARDPDVLTRFPDGILWATLGQQPDVLSLLVGWIQALGDHDFRPTTVEAATAHLRTLLHDRAALLVVDDAWDPSHARPFLVGSDRCRVLITTREEVIAKAVGAALYDLDVMTPAQALALLEGRLGRKPEGEERASARELARVVGYLPLALELAAVQVADGVPWDELLEDLNAEIARLEALEVPGASEVADEATRKRLSLVASFHLSLRRLPEERRVEFAWLGVLPEDANLTPAMMATVWGKGVREARDTLRYLRGKALLLPGVSLPDGTLTYRLHDLLHDLARRLLTAPPQLAREGDLPGLGLSLAEAHARLLERYRARTRDGLWHTLPDDGYIHAHLTWHMEKAGQVEAIHALLREETPEGRNGWYEARERLGQTTGYMADVARAWRLAETEYAARSTHHAIGLQCRYALVTASLNSLAKNIPPALLAALVEKGIWTPAQGLAYARQVPDAGQRAETLAGLAPHLPESLLKEALVAAREIRDGFYRVEVLVTLASHLPQGLRERVLEEALATAQRIEDEYLCARALAGLTPYLPEDLREQALERALAGARDLWEYDRACALLELTPYLPAERRRQVLEEGLAAVWDLPEVGTSTSPRVEALARLAPYLSEELLQRALVMTREIEWEDPRAEALACLAPHLPKQLLPEALAVAREIRNENARAKALASLMPRLAELVHPQEALAVAREIQHMRIRALALASLAPCLPIGLRERTLKEALTAAEKIEEGSLAEVLVRLVPYLLPYLNGEERKQVLEETLVLAKKICDENDYAEMLAKLAPHLPVGEQERVMREVLVAVRRIQDESVRANTLTRLAPHLPKRLLKESLAMTREIQDENDRIRALAGLAAYLPEEMLREVLRLVRKLPDGPRAKTLTKLTPHLTKVLLQQALAAAREIGWRSARNRALVGLIPHLARKMLEQAFVAAQEVEDRYARASALVGLIPHLPEESQEQVLEKALTMVLEHSGTGSPGSLCEALVKLAPYLTEELLHEALTAAQRLPEEGRFGNLRAKALSELAHRLVELGYPEEALATVKGIEYSGDRDEAIANLVAHLAESGYLEEALAAAREIQWRYHRTCGLLKLVPYLPKGSGKQVLREALTTAREIGLEEGRARALASLAPYLPEDEQEQVLEEALAVAREIRNRYDRVSAWAFLVSRLPDDERGHVLREALAAAREIEVIGEVIGIVKVSSIRAYAFSELAPHLAAWVQKNPRGAYEAWKETLHTLARRTRRDLLADLRALEPAIAALGGAEAVAGTFQAIQDVGRWWP